MLPLVEQPPADDDHDRHGQPNQPAFCQDELAQQVAVRHWCRWGHGEISYPGGRRDTDYGTPQDPLRLPEDEHDQHEITGQQQIQSAARQIRKPQVHGMSKDGHGQDEPQHLIDQRMRRNHGQSVVQAGLQPVPVEVPEQPSQDHAIVPLDQIRQHDDRLDLVAAENNDQRQQDHQGGCQRESTVRDRWPACVGDPQTERRDKDRQMQNRSRPAGGVASRVPSGFVGCRRQGDHHEPEPAAQHSADHRPSDPSGGRRKGRETQQAEPYAQAPQGRHSPAKLRKQGQTVRQFAQHVASRRGGHPGLKTAACDARTSSQGEIHRAGPEHRGSLTLLTDRQRAARFRSAGRPLTLLFDDRLSLTPDTVAQVLCKLCQRDHAVAVQIGLAAEPFGQEMRENAVFPDVRLDE